MQCSQPFCGTGFHNNANYASFCPHNSYYYRPQHTLNPEVIGEGDVVSVVLPDGSMHFYFLPITKRPPPFNCNPNAPNYSPHWNSNDGAYYVRSISNPISPSIFTQHCLSIFGAPPNPKQCLFPDCNTTPPPPFQLKFHNDSWSSTTDLHYFVPNIRGLDRRPAVPSKACVAIQVDEKPKEDSTCHQTVCLKPCLCSQEPKRNKRSSAMEIVSDCACHKVYFNSETSVSSSRKSKKSSTKIANRKNIRHKKYKHRKVQKRTSNVDCECHKPCTTDKSVTTYTDQASSCDPEKRTTQTCSTNCGSNTPTDVRSVVKMWSPKTSKNRKMTPKSSERIIGVYETDCSSDSCCCSATDTDGRDL